ncbi:hypothetical protein TOTORO_00830 [Serratia phage vB_SmaS-Totoro]|nr:hypothetical protein TOTORO_00830 [Serratia phage vB_SmaS-Totoro]
MEIEYDFKTPSLWIDKGVVEDAKRFKSLNKSDKKKFIEELNVYASKMDTTDYSSDGLTLLCILLDNIERGYDVEASKVVIYCLLKRVRFGEVTEKLEAATMESLLFQTILRKVARTALFFICTAWLKSFSISMFIAKFAYDFMVLVERRLASIKAVFRYFTVKEHKEKTGHTRSSLINGLGTKISLVFTFLKRKWKIINKQLRR